MKIPTVSRRSVVIHLDFDNEDGDGFVASVPACPGCLSQGDTLEEALMNIGEALNLWMEVAIEDGVPVDFNGVTVFPREEQA